MPRSSMKERVPSVRVALANKAALNPKGDFVLYWMTASRRMTWNYALERAIEHAVELGKPLLLAETLSSGVRWSSDRHHAFGRVPKGAAVRTADAPVWQCGPLAGARGSHFRVASTAWECHGDAPTAAAPLPTACEAGRITC